MSKMPATPSAPHPKLSAEQLQRLRTLIGTILQIEPLSGGHHQLWLATTHKGLFVLRQPLVEPLFGTNYQREARLLQALQGHPWAIDGTIDNDLKNWLVYPFINGETVTAELFTQTPQLWPQLLTIMSQFKQLELPQEPYMRRPMKPYLQHYLKLAQYLPEESALFAQNWLSEFPQPSQLALNHHDLTPANLLRSGQQLVLLDWEYAAFSDKGWDHATLANQFTLTCQQHQQLIQLSGIDESLFRRYQHAAELLDLCWYYQAPGDKALKIRWDNWQKMVKRTKY